MKTQGVTLIGDISKELNTLARERMKRKLLADILFDMEVCRIEGWDVLEYLGEIITMLKGLMPTDELQGHYRQATCRKV